MALDILPIQASAVPCERVFSSSKETCETWQSYIDPILMEALQVLKYHFQQSDALNFTEGLSQEEEIKKIEKEIERAEKEPTDFEKVSS